VRGTPTDRIGADESLVSLLKSLEAVKWHKITSSCHRKFLYGPHFRIKAITLMPLVITLYVTYEDPSADDKFRTRMGPHRENSMLEWGVREKLNRSRNSKPDDLDINMPKIKMRYADDNSQFGQKNRDKLTSA
jgi:hypothetical protein